MLTRQVQTNRIKQNVANICWRLRVFLYADIREPKKYREYFTLSYNLPENHNELFVLSQGQKHGENIMTQ